MKQDLTLYSDDELSLIVMNDEGLYLQRKLPNFISTLKEIFTFTPEQLAVLQKYLEDDAS